VVLSVFVVAKATYTLSAIYTRLTGVGSHHGASLSPCAPDAIGPRGSAVKGTARSVYIWDCISHVLGFVFALGTFVMEIIPETNDKFCAVFQPSTAMFYALLKNAQIVFLLYKSRITRMKGTDKYRRTDMILWILVAICGLPTLIAICMLDATSLYGHFCTATGSNLADGAFILGTVSKAVFFIGLTLMFLAPLVEVEKSVAVQKKSMQNGGTSLRNTIRMNFATALFLAISSSISGAIVTWMMKRTDGSLTDAEAVYVGLLVDSFLSLVLMDVTMDIGLYWRFQRLASRANCADTSGTPPLKEPCSVDRKGREVTDASCGDESVSVPSIPAISTAV
jgi:hypothetical protein